MVAAKTELAGDEPAGQIVRLEGERPAMIGLPEIASLELAQVVEITGREAMKLSLGPANDLSRGSAALAEALHKKEGNEALARKYAASALQFARQAGELLKAGVPGHLRHEDSCPAKAAPTAPAPQSQYCDCGASLTKHDRFHLRVIAEIPRTDFSRWILEEAKQNLPTRYAAEKLGMQYRAARKAEKRGEAPPKPKPRADGKPALGPQVAVRLSEQLEGRVEAHRALLDARRARMREALAAGAKGPSVPDEDVTTAEAVRELLDAFAPAGPGATQQMRRGTILRALYVQFADEEAPQPVRAWVMANALGTVVSETADLATRKALAAIATKAADAASGLLTPKQRQTWEIPAPGPSSAGVA